LHFPFFLGCFAKEAAHADGGRAVHPLVGDAAQHLAVLDLRPTGPHEQQVRLRRLEAARADSRRAQAVRRPQPSARLAQNLVLIKFNLLSNELQELQAEGLV